MKDGGNYLMLWAKIGEFLQKFKKEETVFCSAFFFFSKIDIGIININKNKRRKLIFFCMSLIDLSPRMK